MFSGIVEGKATLIGCQHTPEGSRLTITAPVDLTNTRIGDSIALNGACLTVVENRQGAVSFDVVNETLRKTTLGGLVVGNHVNFERSLQVGDRMHGHAVSGHIDGTIQLLKKSVDGDSICLAFERSETITPYIAYKGSVALAGVSLTVASVSPETFTVYIIPHTAKETILGDLVVGDAVNVEVDLFARYVESILAARGLCQK